MKNHRMFIVKYHGATNAMGARFSVTDTRFKKRVIKPFNYNHGQVSDMAESFLSSLGINIVGRSWNEYNGDDYIFTDDFNTQIKGK